MKYWIITDTHYRHQAIIDKYGRPHDFESRIDGSLAQIEDNDILIHLGDICFKDPAIVHHEKIKPLKCKKWLTIGNHDKKSPSWYIANGWDFVGESLVLPIYGKKIMFSHYPLVVPEGVDFNIHGHFHDNGHRKKDFLTMLDNRHLLLAIERTNYQAVTLEHFFKNAIL